ncbi:MAG: GAF domain-containing protein [Bacteroidales bacterium]|nr:GAF domain-containing protein [Bacteroidales bacterium]
MSDGVKASVRYRTANEGIAILRDTIIFALRLYTMDKRKEGRYSRIYEQLKGLLIKTSNPEARMATICAVLHHKMDDFFWTGFYCLTEGQLIVRTYQGPVACQVLAKDTGVCWAAINQGKTMIVPDVEKFPGHIACDSRSKSEIVVPLCDKNKKIVGVLDVDSDKYETFDEMDALWLGKIVDLIYERS